MHQLACQSVGTMELNSTQSVKGVVVITSIKRNSTTINRMQWQSKCIDSFKNNNSPEHKGFESKNCKTQSVEIRWCHTMNTDLCFFTLLYNLRKSSERVILFSKMKFQLQLSTTPRPPDCFLTTETLWNVPLQTLPVVFVLGASSAVSSSDPCARWNPKHSIVPCAASRSDADVHRQTPVVTLNLSAEPPTTPTSIFCGGTQRSKQRRPH